METLTDLQMTELQAAISVLLEKVSSVVDEVVATGHISPKGVHGLKQALIIPLTVLGTNEYEFQEMSGKANAARETAKAMAAIGYLMRNFG